MLEITSNLSSADVLWAIATAEQPITNADVADILGCEEGRVGNHTVRLWRRGLVVRREQQDGSGRYYEYALMGRGADGSAD